MNAIKLDVEKIAIETFHRVEMAYHLNDESISKYESNDSKLVFPKYSPDNQTNNNVKRVSEQELRFIFVEVLRDYDYYYSIETPTEKHYRFSGKGDSNVPKVDEDGRSGCFDLVLFKNGKRVALIEFKAGGSQKAYEKDFLKLANEGEGKECFFLDLLETANEKTYSAIEKQLTDSIDNIKMNNNNLDCSNIHYMCYSLDNEETKYFDYKTEQLMKFT